MSQIDKTLGISYKSNQFYITHWVTMSGVRLSINDLEDSHLLNIDRVMRRYGSQRLPEYYKILGHRSIKQEMIKRGAASLPSVRKRHSKIETSLSYLLKHCDPKDRTRFNAMAVLLDFTPKEKELLDEINKALDK